jgi:hypothetical protein
VRIAPEAQATSDGAGNCGRYSNSGSNPIILDVNLYKNSHASLCLVLPPVGSAPLEQSVALHAIERATEEDIADLRNASRQLIQATKGGDRIVYFRVKRALHDAQVRAAHNDVLAATMRILHGQARRFWWTYEPTESFRSPPSSIARSPST